MGELEGSIMAKTAPGTVTFVCKPTAHLRCPHFAEPLAQQFWNRLWTARLRIFGRLFPWVEKAIKELAGLPPDAVIGGENHENNVAYQAAHEMYQAGYASDCKEVIAIHDRRVHSHSAHGMLALPARLFRNFQSEVGGALFSSGS
jgi:hypothetical protein